MSEQLVVELLAAHADRLSSPTATVEVMDTDLSADERDELASLMQLADQLKCSMPRVRPSPGFSVTVPVALTFMTETVCSRLSNGRSRFWV